MQLLQWQFMHNAYTSDPTALLTFSVCCLSSAKGALMKELLSQSFIKRGELIAKSNITVIVPKDAPSYTLQWLHRIWYPWKCPGHIRHMEFAPWMMELTDLKLSIYKKILLIIVFKCFCFPIIILPYVTTEVPVSLSKYLCYGTR